VEAQKCFRSSIKIFEHFVTVTNWWCIFGCFAGHQRLPELAKGLQLSRGKRRIAMDTVSARLGVDVAVDKPVLLQHTAKKQTAPQYCAFPRRTTPLPGNKPSLWATDCALTFYISCNVCCQDICHCLCHWHCSFCT